MSKYIVEGTDANFDQEVLNASTPVLVDFWAPWCGPCRMIAPILEEVSAEYQGKLKVVKVNVDHNQKAAERYGVKGIPNMVLFKSGEVQNQIVGYVEKSVLVKELAKLVA